MLNGQWSMILQARLAALKREEEWLHKEQERLEADKAQHIRSVSDSTLCTGCFEQHEHLKKP